MNKNHTKKPASAGILCTDVTERKTGLFENGLIWFGAGVSIAEIVTGTYLAPLGFGKGLAAVLIGHVIGCFLLFLSGVIGGRLRRSAMEAAKLSFGQKGALLFAGLNLLQLVGWTGIMIYDGSLAADTILGIGRWVWCLVIGGLIIFWVLIGIRDLGKVNTVSMTALFLLTIVMSAAVLGKGAARTNPSGAMSFGAAVELSVAMPLSWLPLISDYTRDAEKPVKATAVSATVYGLVSCWMYVIGMGAALFTGEHDIAQVMIKAGLGIAGLLIVVFSTVVTTFPDAYSAGVTCETIVPQAPGKWIAVAAAVIGTVGAIVFPMDDITDFLYLIGSVFTPMIAIQIADYFILRADHTEQSFSVVNLVVWALGFVCYRLLMQADIPVGNSLPDMLITMVLCVIAGRLFPGKKCM